jgi:hypothetical protein
MTLPTEQKAHVCFTQTGQSSSVVPDRPLEHQFLLLLQLENPLLNRVGNHKPHGCNRPMLPQTVCAIESLFFCCRVPPRIQKEGA